MPITSVNISVQKDDIEQVEISLKKGQYRINILDDSIVSDFLDLGFVKDILKEEIIEKKGGKPHFTKPLIINYKDAPLAELYPNGQKKLHHLTGINLGLRLLVHKIASEL